MIDIFQTPLTADEIKAKARELGADIVGIADGAVLEAHPPDPANPQRPSDITDFDADRAIVMGKRLLAGTTRMPRWDERHKYYNDELTITALEELSLELVLWLEDNGYPALVVPPSHVDPWRYVEDPAQHVTPLLSLNHAAVEAGLGTLGLNLQLLTPEFGPRLMLTAVLSSVDVEADQPMPTALCKGPECGRCLKACPGDVIGHWDRDWPACDRYRSPHGFYQLVEYLERIMDEPDRTKQREMLRSEDSFNLWQSILRGAGVVTGCRRCQDVCPVGADYDRMIGNVLDDIPENTPEKEARLAHMVASEADQRLPDSHKAQARWIGARSRD